MEGSVALWLCILTRVIAAPTEAVAIIFPGQLRHREGDSCHTSTGGLGTCSEACKHLPVRGDPRKCGIKNSQFLVCCEPKLGNGRLSFTDIAPPSVSFECGLNSLGALRSSVNVTGDVLRPEAVPDPTLSKVQEITLARHNISRVFKRSPKGLSDVPLEEMPTDYEDYPLAFTAPAIGSIDALTNAWPWMAIIGERDAQGIRWFCGGVLINDRWVLTALHCFFNNKPDVVRLGEHNYNDDGDGARHEDFGVAETVLYPNYNPPEAYHDLALLRLVSKVVMKHHISPVCLPWGEESDKDIIGQKATLTGWGDTAFGGQPSSVLQEVNVTVFPPAQCDRGYSSLPHYPATWPRGIGKETLCAGDIAGGRDACQGDSGGPLVSLDASGHFQLAGIVSRGFGCGHKDYPGLYANLRYPPYLSWIKTVAFATS